MQKTITIVDNPLSEQEDIKAKEILRLLEGMTVHSIYRILNRVEANVIVYKTVIPEESPLLKLSEELSALQLSKNMQD